MTARSGGPARLPHQHSFQSYSHARPPCLCCCARLISSKTCIPRFLPKARYSMHAPPGCIALVFPHALWSAATAPLRLAVLFFPFLLFVGLWQIATWCLGASPTCTISLLNLLNLLYQAALIYSSASELSYRHHHPPCAPLLKTMRHASPPFPRLRACPTGSIAAPFFHHSTQHNAPICPLLPALPDIAQDCFVSLFIASLCAVVPHPFLALLLSVVPEQRAPFAP